MVLSAQERGWVIWITQGQDSKPEKAYVLRGGGGGHGLLV